jgi:DNA-binding NarL/FixJ family response regulator
MKILIVDDRILFREGLVMMLTTQSDLAIVGEAGSVAEAVEKSRQI